MFLIQRWPLTSKLINMVFGKASCGSHSCFVLRHSQTTFGTQVYHHWTKYHMHSLLLYDLDRWPQYQSYIFTMNLFLRDYLCFLTKAYQILHIGVSPWDNMLFTFMTSVWPWRLTWRLIFPFFSHGYVCWDFNIKKVIFFSQLFYLGFIWYVWVSVR